MNTYYIISNGHCLGLAFPDPGNARLYAEQELGSEFEQGYEIVPVRLPTKSSTEDFSIEHNGLNLDIIIHSDRLEVIFSLVDEPETILDGNTVYFPERPSHSSDNA